MSSPHSPASLRPRLRRTQLTALAAGLVGLQFGWAVQVGYVTKTVLQLGLDPRWTGVVWLAGPIAGIVVQPLVGLWSDGCRSRFGRRRPFIVGGAVVTIAALGLFGYAEEVGEKLGVGGLGVAIAAFWTLDFALNASQGPLRALMADLAPAEQQQEGNAWFAFATGFGNVAGGVLGGVKLGSLLGGGWRSDGQALYVVAMGVVAAGVGCCVLGVKEEVWDGEEGRRGGGYESVGVDRDDRDVEEDGGGGELTDDSSFLDVVRLAPYPFLDVFAMQCFTWFAYFCMFVYATSWVGENVYGGSSSAPAGSASRELYEAGVRVGNVGLALQAVVSMATSTLLPRAVGRLGAEAVLAGAHCVLGAVLAATLFVKGEEKGWLAAALLGATGVSWATTMTVPWGMVSAAVVGKAPRRAGQYLTVFNLSQCFPEIAVSCVSGLVIAATGSQASVLGLGGAIAFGGAGYVLVQGVGEGDYGDYAGEKGSL